MLDISDPTFKADPYVIYDYVRAEKPLIKIPFVGRQTAWLVTRYADVLALLRDPRFVKNPRNAGLKKDKVAIWIPEFARPLSQNMLDLDAPDHTRLRALVQKAFTPRMVEQLRPRIETLTAELLHKAKHERQFDLISTYALPVPLTIISELFGIAPNQRDKFHQWVNTLFSISSLTDMARVMPTLWSLMRFLRQLVQERRRDPQDDLTTALVQAEEAGEQLSEDEVIAMIFLLLSAGHETTVNLIGSGTLALIQHPDQCQRLRENPSMIKSAVEELARFVSPVECSTERYAREDVTWHGITIRRGDLVLGSLNSANHDEQQFAQPKELDLEREQNRHVAFGIGAHFCVGAPLAKLEAQVAFTALLEHYPNLQLAVPTEQLRWRKNLFLRGLQALPLVG